MSKEPAAKPEPACKHCTYWQDTNAHYGKCRINPPDLPPKVEPNIWNDRGRWRLTEPNDMCGAYIYRGTPSDRK